MDFNFIVSYAVFPGIRRPRGVFCRWDPRIFILLEIVVSHSTIPTFANLRVHIVDFHRLVDVFRAETVVDFFVIAKSAATFTLPGPGRPS